MNSQWLNTCIIIDFKQLVGVGNTGKTLGEFQRLTDDQSDKATQRVYPMNTAV